MIQVRKARTCTNITGQGVTVAFRVWDAAALVQLQVARPTNLLHINMKQLFAAFLIVAPAFGQVPDDLCNAGSPCCNLNYTIPEIPNPLITSVSCPGDNFYDPYIWAACVTNVYLPLTEQILQITMNEVAQAEQDLRNMIAYCEAEYDAEVAGCRDEACREQAYQKWYQLICDTQTGLQAEIDHLISSFDDGITLVQNELISCFISSGGCKPFSDLPGNCVPDRPPTPCMQMEFTCGLAMPNCGFFTNDKPNLECASRMMQAAQEDWQEMLAFARLSEDYACQQYKLAIGGAVNVYNESTLPEEERCAEFSALINYAIMEYYANRTVIMDTATERCVEIQGLLNQNVENLCCDN